MLGQYTKVFARLVTVTVQTFKKVLKSKRKSFYEANMRILPTRKYTKSGAYWLKGVVLIINIAEK